MKADPQFIRLRFQKGKLRPREGLAQGTPSWKQDWGPGLLIPFDSPLHDGDCSVLASNLDISSVL